MIPISVSRHFPFQTAGTLIDGSAVMGCTIPPPSDAVNRDLTPRSGCLHTAPGTFLGMSAPAALSLRGSRPRTFTWLPEGLGGGGQDPGFDSMRRCTQMRGEGGPELTMPILDASGMIP